LSGSILPESTTSNHKVATESQLPSSVAQYLSTLPIPDSSSQPSIAPYLSPLSQTAASGSSSTYSYFPSTIPTVPTGGNPSNYVANPTNSFASVPGSLTYGAAVSSSIDTSSVISSETSRPPLGRLQDATTSAGVSTTQLLPSTPLELSSVQFFLEIEEISRHSFLKLYEYSSSERSPALSGWITFP